jgi:hypothetical protein
MALFEHETLAFFAGVFFSGLMLATSHATSVVSVAFHRAVDAIMISIMLIAQEIACPADDTSITDPPRPDAFVSPGIRGNGRDQRARAEVLALRKMVGDNLFATKRRSPYRPLLPPPPAPPPPPPPPPAPAPDVDGPVPLTFVGPSGIPFAPKA